MSTKYGIATGSDFGNSFIVAAHKDNAPALEIMKSGKEDYIFVKDDVSEFSLMGTNITFTMNGELKYGNKYRIVFKDGKSAIFNVVAGGCSAVENLLY